MLRKKWKTIIGLEIHAQILTTSKLFSSSYYNNNNNSSNTLLSLFDIGYPGTLPKLNYNSIIQAIKAANSLKCKINKISMFERKHYFYQDLPLGYQITQSIKPIAELGKLEFDVTKDGKFLYKKSVGITRIQLEQDSGKSIHDRHPDYTLVDLNRAGVGLLEIVFEPELQTADEASSALRAMQRLFRHIKVCDGNLQDGSMRCDVNISIMEDTNDETTDNNNNSNNNKIIGNRVEIKNLNSMQKVSDAINYEIKRHIELLEAGEIVPRETRKFDISTGTTIRLRSKETAVDYRIFSDPDLPLLEITDEEIQAILTNDDSSELPDDTSSRLQIKYGLNSTQSNRLVTSMAVEYFEQCIELLSKKVEINHDVNQIVFNWIFGDLLGKLNELNISFTNSPVSPNQLAEIISMIIPPPSISSTTLSNNDNIQISGPQAKILLQTLFQSEYCNKSPYEIVIEKKWKLITDSNEIREFVFQSINDPRNQKNLKKYRSGNEGMIKYFFGDVMKLGKGQIDPKKIENILIEVLKETSNDSELVN